MDEIMRGYNRYHLEKQTTGINEFRSYDTNLALNKIKKVDQKHKDIKDTLGYDFICSVCGGKFKKAENLNNHMEFH